MIIYPGTSIVTIFARRQTQPSVSFDESYLAVLRRSRVPKLEYASSVRNPYTQCNIDEIEMVQRRAARFVYNDYSRFHPSAIRTWNSLPKSVIPESLSEFKAIIASM